MPASRSAGCFEVLPELDPMAFGIPESRELSFAVGVATPGDRRGFDASLMEGVDDGLDVVDAVVDDVALACPWIAGHDREDEMLLLLGSLVLAEVQLRV